MAGVVATKGLVHPFSSCCSKCWHSVVFSFQLAKLGALGHFFFTFHLKCLIFGGLFQVSIESLYTVVGILLSVTSKIKLAVISNFPHGMLTFVNNIIRGCSLTKNKEKEERREKVAGSRGSLPFR